MTHTSALYLCLLHDLYIMFPKVNHVLIDHMEIMYLISTINIFKRYLYFGKQHEIL